MIEHTQTILGLGGDCWRSCVASLLDIEDQMEVPHFVERFPEDWWDQTQRFIAAHTRRYRLDYFLNPPFPLYLYPESAPQFVILTGPSPRLEGTGHAVIGSAITGRIVWDPHPSRIGLPKVDDAFALVDL